MENYARKLPKDNTGAVMTEFAHPFVAYSTTARDNATVSSVTALGNLTTTVEVAAVGVGAGVKWATNQATSVITAAGTANFDNFVPAGTVRRFVVPRQTQAISPSVAGINVEEGLYAAVATKSAGIGSVLLTQY